MEALTAYKFAKDVLPLMLADAAQGHQPALHPEQPAEQPQQAPVQAPPQAQVSDPNQAQNIPQGQTAVNSPAIPAPTPVEPHTPGTGQQKAAVNLAGATALGHSALDVLNRAAVNYSVNGVPGLVAEPSAALIAGTKKVLGNVLGKYKSAPTGSMTKILPSLLKHADEQKEAGLGSAAMNFGRGMLAATKPVTGLLRGGLPGAGRGLSEAAKTIYRGGPAVGAGAGAAVLLGASTLRNPIVSYGDGFKIQSPVHIPQMRFRSPVNINSSGIRFQTPVKTLW